MLTDTSLMRNPYVHQMSVTVVTLDLRIFCWMVEGLAGAAMSTEAAKTSTLCRNLYAENA